MTLFQKGENGAIYVRFSTPTTRKRMEKLFPGRTRRRAGRRFQIRIWSWNLEDFCWKKSRFLCFWEVLSIQTFIRVHFGTLLMVFGAQNTQKLGLKFSQIRIWKRLVSGSSPTAASSPKIKVETVFFFSFETKIFSNIFVWRKFFSSVMKIFSENFENFSKNQQNS